MFIFLSKTNAMDSMMTAVLFYSAKPVLFDLGGAAASPFLFTAIWLASTGIGVGLALLFTQRALLSKPSTIEGIRRHCATRLMAVAVATSCGLALFAAGLSFIDAVVAAVIFETWPMFHIAAMAMLFRGGTRYASISATTVIFALMAFAGVTLVIISQGGISATDKSVMDHLDLDMLFGGCLVLLAAICGSVQGSSLLRLGWMLAERHAPSRTRDAGEIVFSTLMTCIAQTMGAIVICVIGLAMSETISMTQATYAVVAGLFSASLGGILFRAANTKTRDLGVNAISYTTPAVAMVWLWMFSTVDVSHAGHLVIGVAGVVAANVVINAGASMSTRDKVLIAVMWICGTAIYLDVPSVVPWLAFDPGTQAVAMLVSSCVGLLLFDARRYGTGGRYHEGDALRRGGRGVVTAMSLSMVAMFPVLIYLS